MKTTHLFARLTLMALTGFALERAGLAQSLTFSDWTTGSSSISSFTIDTTGDTLSTDSPYYTANLQGSLETLFSTTAVPVIFQAYTQTADQGGWILPDSAGVAVIAQNGVTLTDPFVSYSTSFANTSGSGGAFSETFDSVFSPITFDGAADRATFGITLTDGSAGGTGVSENSTQTAELINTVTSASTPLPQVTLTDNQSISGGQTTSVPTATTGDPLYLVDPSIMGTYNELAVIINGSYTAGAEVGVTGRVDVTTAPEPAPLALLVVAGVGTLVFRVRRSMTSLA